MVNAHGQESGHMLVGPGIDLFLLRRLGDLSRHGPTSGGAAPQQSFLDGVREGSPQHCPANLDGPPRQVHAGRQTVEPPSDVLPIEPVESNCTEAALDVWDRPLVLLASL
jgi:hypothetical protein